MLRLSPVSFSILKRAAGKLTLSPSGAFAVLNGAAGKFGKRSYVGALAVGTVVVVGTIGTIGKLALVSSISTVRTSGIVPGSSIEIGAVELTPSRSGTSPNGKLPYCVERSSIPRDVLQRSILHTIGPSKFSWSQDSKHRLKN